MSDIVLQSGAATGEGSDSGFGQASSERVHEQVYQQLRWAIISGQLDPGRSISVRSLAAEFGVSTMPAREAIRRLVALGALELTPTRRVTVAKMTMEKYQELTEARLALEPALALRALNAVKDDPGSVDRLVSELSDIDEKIDRAIKQRDSGVYARRNCEFHHRLYSAANSPVYLGLVESLWLQLGPFIRSLVNRLGDNLVVDEHKVAIEAIRTGDAAKLEKAIRDDVGDSVTRISPSDFKV